MTSILIVAGSYLLGAIPSSYLAGRLGGVDLRERGSKNLGATNVYRVLGWAYAAPVAIFDVAKGFLPVLYATSRTDSEPWLPVASGVAAVMGHVFSIYLRFRGGKGVATASGAVLALAPAALAVSAGLWLLLVLATRYVSVGSILGAISFPIAVLLLEPGDSYTAAAGIVLAGFIVFTHRANIRRLVAGTENRVGRPHGMPGGAR
ncbi:MAG: glycerol-3-phosphate 1-O-acyltransferase PlsY [Gemmatimonadales bacterium]